MILTICLSLKRDAVCDLYKNIVNCFPKKEESIVIIPSAYKEEEFSNNFFKILREEISLSKTKYNKIKKIWMLLSIINKLIKKYKINNIYIHTENFFSFLFLFICFFRKKNITIWLHDPILHEGSLKIEYIKRKIGYLSYLKYAKNIIISYNNVFKEINNNKSLKKICNKFKVIYLPQMRELEFEDIKNDISIKQKYDFIFYGRIEEYKGLDLLLEVFKDEKLKNIKLLIVGRGRNDKEIKEKIKNVKNIIFINEYVPNRELAKYIMESKFVILPYKTATGTQTIQIANYYNKMVLATKVGCFAEYIKEGENGFFINNFSKEILKKEILKYYYIKNIDINNIYNIYKNFDLKQISYKLYNVLIENQ